MSHPPVCVASQWLEASGWWRFTQRVNQWQAKVGGRGRLDYRDNDPADGLGLSKSSKRTARARALAAAATKSA